MFAASGPARGAIRLAHVFPTFDVGGVQVRFAALAARLGGRFHHTIISLGGGDRARELLAADTPVVFAEPASSAGPLPTRLAAFRARLAALEPDILVTYNWGAIEYALANRFAGLPHLHHEDGFGPEESHGQLRRRVWTRRLALARSDVVVPSLTLRDIAQRTWRLAPDRVHHIPNGIEPGRHPATSLEALAPGLPEGLPRVVWTGALRPEKNPLRLLRAFAAVRDRAVLVVIGEGPEREAMEHEARRRGLGTSLRMLGHRTDARDIIAQCQILVLSSDTEQMPISVMEAMDAGLAVVATDVGDVARMVASENRPYITPPDDARLAGALRRLLDDEALRARLGRANQERLRTAYPMEAMVEAYRALLIRLAARRQAAEHG